MVAYEHTYNGAWIDEVYSYKKKYDSLEAQLKAVKIQAELAKKAQEQFKKTYVGGDLIYTKGYENSKFDENNYIKWNQHIHQVFPTTETTFKKIDINKIEDQTYELLFGQKKPMKYVPGENCVF